MTTGLTPAPGPHLPSPAAPLPVEPPRRRRRSTPRGTAGWVPPQAPQPEPVYEPQPLPRQRRWMAKEGWYARRGPRHTTTTRQGRVLNLALSDRSSKPQRVAWGISQSHGGIYYYDQFLSYADPTEPGFSSTVVALLGDIGSGKSTCLKCNFVLRQLMLGRRVVVLDKKLQGTRGEYAPVADQVGTRSVLLVPGGGPGTARINLLDPVISTRLSQRIDDDNTLPSTPSGTGGGAGEQPQQRPTGQLQLVYRVAAEASDHPLTALEQKAIRVALPAAHARGRGEGREAVLADLIWCLLHPAEHDAAAIDETTAELRRWGRDVGYALENLIEGDLAGLVDGPTSPEVNFDHPSGLTVFDISALPEDGHALPIVMLLVQTWLTNLLTRRAAERLQTVLVIEEGWHVTAGAMGAQFRNNVKLSRGLGLSVAVGLHHPKDMPPDSPARALINEAGTLILFGQADVDDIADTLNLAKLPPAVGERLGSLPQGVCIIKRKGAEAEEVRLYRSAEEVELTNTDRELTGQTGPA